MADPAPAAPSGRTAAPPAAAMGDHHAAAAARPTDPGFVPTVRFIPYITEVHRGLNFPIMERKVPNGKILRVKRFVEKGNVDLSDAIAFKSKVVSRQHGEVWTEGMNFFYRDTKSSSGTFINNVRVAPANTESAPIQLKDGDIIQLGVDYQGRTEDIFRCVRMRVELNREAFKHRNNAFRTQVIKALRTLAAASDKDTKGTGDCCICLGAIAPFQALFIAPCCHSFHYKCARPLLATWPNFSCPLCRHFADLSVSVSVEDLSLLGDDDDANDDNTPSAPPAGSAGAAAASAAAPVAIATAATSTSAGSSPDTPTGPHPAAGLPQVQTPPVPELHHSPSLPNVRTVGPTPVVSVHVDDDHHDDDHAHGGDASSHAGASVLNTHEMSFGLGVPLAAGNNSGSTNSVTTQVASHAASNVSIHTAGGGGSGGGDDAAAVHSSQESTDTEGIGGAPNPQFFTAFATQGGRVDTADRHMEPAGGADDAADSSSSSAGGSSRGEDHDHGHHAAKPASASAPHAEDAQADGGGGDADRTAVPAAGEETRLMTSFSAPQLRALLVESELGPANRVAADVRASEASLDRDDAAKSTAALPLPPPQPPLIPAREPTRSRRTTAESAPIKVQPPQSQAQVQTRPAAAKRAPRISARQYLSAALHGADVLQGAEQKSERVSNFLSVPLELEKTLWLGYIVCLDAFFAIFTILPLRVLVAFQSVFRSVVRRTPLMHRQHIMDVWRAVIMGAACAALYQIDPSWLYHTIRGQSMMKLYVIFNLLEVCDKLCCSFGMDILDSLFARSLHGPEKTSLPLPVHFVLAGAYVTIHSIVLYYQMVTLNVSINSYSNGLLPLLISNQFVEIKSSVFKRFEAENLFQLSCADMVERMNLTVYLSLNVARNFLELLNNTDGRTSLSLALPYVTWTAAPGGNAWQVASLAAHSAQVAYTEVSALVALLVSSSNLLADAQTLVIDIGSRVLASFAETATTLGAALANDAYHVGHAAVTSQVVWWEWSGTAPAWVPLAVDVLSPALLVAGSEVLVDWLKHAFITKFNNLRPEEVYRRYRRVLCIDIVSAVSTTAAAHELEKANETGEAAAPVLAEEPRGRPIHSSPRVGSINVVRTLPPSPPPPAAALSDDPAPAPSVLPDDLQRQPPPDDTASESDATVRVSTYYRDRYSGSSNSVRFGRSRSVTPRGGARKLSPSPTPVPTPTRRSGTAAHADESSERLTKTHRRSSPSSGGRSRSGSHSRSRAASTTPTLGMPALRSRRASSTLDTVVEHHRDGHTETPPPPVPPLTLDFPAAAAAALNRPIPNSAPAAVPASALAKHAWLSVDTLASTSSSTRGSAESIPPAQPQPAAASPARAAVSSSYALSQDMVPYVSRRIGFGALPLAVVAVRMWLDIAEAAGVTWNFAWSDPPPALRLSPGTCVAAVRRVLVETEWGAAATQAVVREVPAWVVDRGERATVAGLAVVDQFGVLALAAVVAYLLLLSFKLVIGMTLLDQCLAQQQEWIAAGEVVQPIPELGAKKRDHGSSSKSAAGKETGGGGDAPKVDKLSTIDRYTLVKSRIP
ncbi:hypothetical protein H9P43_004200 [Blastocladiella emersonii ATCC 22665]|nr:hypothetical protein H9P43_004200 [Blastocladiella emersonii ATCC 22665]